MSSERVINSLTWYSLRKYIVIISRLAIRSRHNIISMIISSNINSEQVIMLSAQSEKMNRCNKTTYIILKVAWFSLKVFAEWVLFPTICAHHFVDLNKQPRESTRKVLIEFFRKWPGFYLMAIAGKRKLIETASTRRKHKIAPENIVHHSWLLCGGRFGAIVIMSFFAICLLMLSRLSITSDV